MTGPCPTFAALPTMRVEDLKVVARGPDTARVHQALRSEAALLALDHRALLVIDGTETADLLHRVTSQDTQGMAVGAGAPSCILTGKGKLQAYFELFRPREDCFLAEIDRSRREPLRELLDRYIFAERIELQNPDWLAVGLFGPAAEALLGAGSTAVVPRGEGFLLHSQELGVPGYRFHGPAEEVDALARELAEQEVPLGGFEDYEALRIDGGKPRWGLDADEKTIPLEVGLSDACNTEKGCYIGQEIVARIHTYGHVNRQLCRVTAAVAEIPEPGALLYDEGIEAGRVTSSYVSPVDGRLHGLALLPSVLSEAGTILNLGAEEGPEVEVL